MHQFDGRFLVHEGCIKPLCDFLVCPQELLQSAWKVLRTFWRLENLRKPQASINMSMSLPRWLKMWRVQRRPRVFSFMSTMKDMRWQWRYFSSIWFRFWWWTSYSCIPSGGYAKFFKAFNSCSNHSIWSLQLHNSNGQCSCVFMFVQLEQQGRFIYQGNERKQCIIKRKMLYNLFSFLPPSPSFFLVQKLNTMHLLPYRAEH